MSLVFVIFNESLLIIYKISTEHIVVYNVVSSAYQIILKISVKDRSLIYIKHSNDPRIDPCGTPVCKGNKSDSISSKITYFYCGYKF